MADKKELISQKQDRKELSYKKGDVNLNLNFRVDIKDDMVDLVAILKRAQSDIQQMIDGKDKTNGK